MLQHAHPTKLILDTLASIWGLYFFWHQELVRGLLALFLVGGLGTLLTARYDKTALARAPLGKLFLVSARPLNAVLQLAGYVVIAFGTWHHLSAQVLVGVTLVLTGHLGGWDQVRDRLRAAD